jgi:hypothetical protein
MEVTPLQWEGQYHPLIARSLPTSSSEGSSLPEAKHERDPTPSIGTLKAIGSLIEGVMHFFSKLCARNAAGSCSFAAFPQ